MTEMVYKAPRIFDITVPDLLTLIAQQNPRRYLVQTIREHVNAPTECEHITFSTFIRHVYNAAAALRAQWAQTVKDETLKAQASRPRNAGEPLVVVGMLGTNGYEFYVNIWACSLNRWTVLLISPKNSPEAIEHLLRSSKANILLVDRLGQQLSSTSQESIKNMATLQFAGLDSSTNDFLRIPLTAEETKKELDLPAFYMHTSGSTGHPKLITWTHRFFLSGYRMRLRDGPEDIGKYTYSAPPLIHAVGMFANALFALALSHIVVFVTTAVSRPPSASTVLFSLPFMKDAVLALPPSILEEILDLGPEAVKALADGASKVVFAGAPLNQKIGDELVAAGVKLVSAYGSTEINPGTKIVRNKRPEDWSYVEFREGYNWQFLPVDDHSDLRELIVGPGEDTPAVINHENPRGFATNDIWRPHPTIPHLWKHHSRKGDVTVLSNGEKTDNKQIENLLRGNNLIRYVQVFGAGRPLNGVILQPADYTTSPRDFLSQIQPTIEHANSVLPKHSRLVPQLILVAPEHKPFVITDKGTIRTKETVDKFAEEIESCYAALEEGGGDENTFEGDKKNPQDVKDFVRKAVKKILQTDVDDDEDLFDHGFDSLLAIQLRASLLPVLRSSPAASQSVPCNITYTYPSVDALTTYLLSHTSAQNGHMDNTSDRIRRSISKYSSNFVPHRPGSKEAQGVVVALTGSTGSVGSSLLSILLQRDDVSKIYLLNRKGAISQQERQAAGFRERAIDTSALEEKSSIITYLDVDLSRHDLGLAAKDYAELRDNVTHIIHSAWHLNFNLILESYERVHIAGVRNLIDLALASPHSQSPRLTFLSSIAGAAGYHNLSSEGQAIIPEEPIDDPTIALDQGYGQGKYVSERVLVAAVQAGLRTTIVRVGQLSGTSTNGAWSPSEHVPITLRSSIELGMIPDDLPAVRWVPSDVAASVIVKQTFGSETALEYFHLENNVPTPWKAIAQTVAECSPRPLSLVSHKVWLERIAEKDVDVEKVPAVRLLDFFQGVAEGRESAVLGWQRSVQVAPELACGAISSELVKKYVSYQLGKSHA